MSVRKRRSTDPQGDAKDAWVVDYIDGEGDRHVKTFTRKRNAEAWHATTTIEVNAGVAMRRLMHHDAEKCRSACRPRVARLAGLGDQFGGG